MRRPLVVAVLAVGLVLLGGGPVGAGGGNDGPGPVVGDGTIGTGTFVGGPGSGTTGGGGSIVVGTWDKTFMGLCFDSGGELLILPLPWPFVPFFPIIPIGDLSGEFAGFVYFMQLISPGGDVLTEYVWNECDPAAPPEPTTPPTFAEIFRAIPLPVPGMVTSPEVDGLVGLQNWFWWESTTGSQGMTASVSTPPLNGQWVASGTARITKVVWKLGNGDTVTAPESRLPGSKTSPAARYTYQFGDDYTMTATAYWTVSFSLTNTVHGFTVNQGTGWTTTSNTRDYAVHEVEAVADNSS